MARSASSTFRMIFRLDFIEIQPISWIFLEILRNFEKWRRLVVFELVEAPGIYILISNFEFLPVSWAIWKCCRYFRILFGNFKFFHGFENFLLAKSTSNIEKPINLKIRLTFIWIVKQLHYNELKLKPKIRNCFSELSIKV